VAIAHDSQALGVANVSAATYTTAITPTNPPAGVHVALVYNSTLDLITAGGVTYAGILLTRRRFDTEATEAGAVLHYWGAAVFPTGAQNVVVNRVNSAVSMMAVVSTMTVAAGMTVAVDSDATGLSASVANPSWAHSSLVDNVVAYLAIHSGLTTMTTTPATNWTLQASEDYGAQGRGFARRTLGTAGALAPGWTASTADDFVGSSIAFKEAPITTVATGRQAAVSRRAVNRAATW
jgi:hypothetical protein